MEGGVVWGGEEGRDNRNGGVVWGRRGGITGMEGGVVWGGEGRDDCYGGEWPRGGGGEGEQEWRGEEGRDRFIVRLSIHRVSLYPSQLAPIPTHPPPLHSQLITHGADL